MNESSVFWIRSWAFFSAELYRSFIYTELFSLILSSIELDTLLTLLSRLVIIPATSSLRPFNILVVSVLNSAIITGTVAIWSSI